MERVAFSFSEASVVNQPFAALVSWVPVALSVRGHFSCRIRLKSGNSCVETPNSGGWLYLENSARHIGEDPDVHLLTDLKGVRDHQVNAFQRASQAVLQMSTREGFGLTVAEALW